MGNGYRHIGVAAPRRDARQIVTGSNLYLGDRKFPNLLYARVLRSPVPHARIRRVVTARAKALPGVKAVLTHADIPDWRGGTPRYVRALDETVRYVGDAVALVAATSEDIAAEALGLIEVEYESLPAVYDMEAALEPDAPQLYEQFPGNTLRSGTAWFGPKCLRDIAFGDVEKGFAEADVVVEGTCGYENLPGPLPPESPGVVAQWEEPDRVTLWLSSQGAYQDKVILYFAFGRNVHVRTIGGPCGGSYGSRYMSIPIQLQATALSRATGRPVRLCLTKEEHMAAFGLRIESRIRGKVGMTRDGRVTAIAGDWLVGTGVYSLTTQAQVAVGCGEAQLAVRCANWDLRTKIVCANRAPSGIVRGFGGQELKCSLLPLLALAMEKLDIDPLEFFKKNYVKPGDTYFWRDGEEYTYRGTDYSRAMDAGARAFGWAEKWKGWLRPTAVEGARRTGIGVGVHGNADIGEDVSEAYVRLDPNGTATIYSAATEHGTGQPSNFCKMVAEVLQLPLDRIFMTPPDSDITPYDFGPVGSRGTYAMGSAIIRAAEDALAELLRLAAPHLGCAPEDLATEDGMIFVKTDPATQIRWTKAIGVDETVLGKGRFKPDFTLANCMMSFVEVAVDTETGKVEILRVVNATDAGQIIDPPGLQNQLNGCLGSAGIDSALFEETVLDRSTGHILNANMVDYKWRTFNELPTIDNVVLETPVDSHRFHAVGVGEVATAPGPMALVMAVSNAVGVRLYDYPVTPAKVLEALGKTHRPVPKKGRAS
jgi:xanthine dehydrogenase molybdenum-binding subunit